VPPRKGGAIRAGSPVPRHRLVGISQAARFPPRADGRTERVPTAPQRAVRGGPFHLGPCRGTLGVPKPTTVPLAAAPHTPLTDAADQWL
jgi:hypothetical protein